MEMGCTIVRHRRRLFSRLSEQILGKAVERRRDKVLLATKTGMAMVMAEPT